MSFKSSNEFSDSWMGGKIFKVICVSLLVVAAVLAFGTEDNLNWSLKVIWTNFGLESLSLNDRIEDITRPSEGGNKDISAAPESTEDELSNTVDIRIQALEPTEQNNPELIHDYSSPNNTWSSLETLEQNITNSFLERLSKYRFPQPLKDKEFESSFPTDTTLMARLQNGELTPEEEKAFRGKRLVILGDSVDAYMFGQVLTCIRMKIKTRSGFTYPRKKDIQCTFQTDSRGESVIDKMLQGIFEKYEFEIVLHRASYGIDPLIAPHAIRHKSFRKGSRLFEAKTMSEQYKVLLEDSFEHLPDTNRADMILFNVNLWIRQLEELKGRYHRREEVIDGLRTYVEVAKNFFNPKALAFHTVPEVRSFRPRGIRDLNENIRLVTQKERIGLFDWETMAKDLSKGERLRDRIHPSPRLNDRFGNMMLAWCLEVFKAQQISS